MQNPFQQTANGNLNDPLAFVKKLWGDMQLPGMVTPTLSVDELDKQIKDLKTVESWLNVNMNMLKGTIQALEVQRATISALKTMGESFAQASNAASSEDEKGDQSDKRDKGAGDRAGHHAAWPMHTNSHNIPEPTVEENEDEQDNEGPDEEDHVRATQSQSQDTGEAESAKAAQSQFHHPAAWWTVLQDQFKQALSHAMKDEAPEVVHEAKKAAPVQRKARNSATAKNVVETKAVKGASKVGERSATSKASTTKSTKAAKAKATIAKSRTTTSTTKKASKTRGL